MIIPVHKEVFIYQVTQLGGILGPANEGDNGHSCILFLKDDIVFVPWTDYEAEPRP